jgi:hypothetical protein
VFCFEPRWFASFVVSAARSCKIAFLMGCKATKTTNNSPIQKLNVIKKENNDAWMKTVNAIFLLAGTERRIITEFSG